MPNMVMKMMIRRPSTNPNWKTVTPKAPRAKVETFMLAASHCMGPTSSTCPNFKEHLRACAAAYHCPHNVHALVRSFIFGNSFDPSLFDMEPFCKPLQLSKNGVALGKVLRGCQAVPNIDGALLFLVDLQAVAALHLIVVHHDQAIALGNMDDLVNKTPCGASVSSSPTGLLNAYEPGSSTMIEDDETPPHTIGAI